jgi:tyrosyl-tRNA synthetase
MTYLCASLIAKINSMDFLKELEWRGMLHQTMPGVDEVLAKGKCVGYIGFDPTAPSLTIGNYVQIMLLTLFQQSGHQPIVLMGGATGRIGDPSGKDKERELKTTDELDQNLAHQVAQMKRFINFENGENKAILVNNFDFYKEMNVLDFLRNVGKTLTVNYMKSKDSVKKRLDTEDGGEGMSFTEFSYQLLQGYDYQCLYNQYGCIIQMGGSDQWGNITSGTEFIRRNVGGKAYAITTPLLTKADGSKFGKSEKGNIWLDAKMTSPYQFYQFWLKCNDADLSKFIRYFTLKSKEEVEALEAEYANNPNALKQILAEELTVRIHSLEAYEDAKRATVAVFGKDKEVFLGLTLAQFDDIAQTIDTFTMPKSLLGEGVSIIEVLAGEATKIYPSNSEARKGLQGNAIAINKEKTTDQNKKIIEADLIHGKYLFIEKGKTNKYLVLFQ